MTKQIRMIAKSVVALVVLGFAHGVLAEEFEAPLVACLSNGTAIGGVNSCGKIWKLRSGKAELKAGGSVQRPVKNVSMKKVRSWVSMSP